MATFEKLVGPYPWDSYSVFLAPGYGGGMSSAKAALESDTRTLAYEAGRKWGHRVNVLSAGPWASAPDFTARMLVAAATSRSVVAAGLTTNPGPI